MSIISIFEGSLECVQHSRGAGPAIQPALRGQVLNDRPGLRSSWHLHLQDTYPLMQFRLFVMSTGTFSYIFVLGCCHLTVALSASDGGEPWKAVCGSLD